MTIGIHILAEFYGVDSALLERVEAVQQILESSVVEAKLAKLHSHYHQFSPFGVTGFVLLAESHISIHTWPERNYLALDVFTCGKQGKAERAYRCLLKKFCPTRVEKIVKVRGSEQAEKTSPIVAKAVK